MKATERLRQWVREHPEKFKSGWSPAKLAAEVSEALGTKIVPTQICAAYADVCCEPMARVREALEE